MTTKRRPLTIAAVVAALFLAGASLAWACTPGASIGLFKGDGSGEAQTSGAAGDPVIVEGNAFVEGTVEIRWNDVGGQILATAQGPSFSVGITIPNVPQDTYTVTAVAYEETGEVAGVGRARFTVTSGAPAEEPRDNKTTSGGEQGGGGDGTTSGEADGREGSGGRSGRTSGTVSGAESPSAGGREPENTGARQPGDQPSTREAAPGSPRNDGVGGERPPTPLREVVSLPPSEAPGFVRTADGDVVFGGSLPNRLAQLPDGATSTTRGESTGGISGSPSEGTASGDIWSGFASGDAPSLSGSGGGSAGGAGQLSIGIGMVAAGLLTLFGGLLLATVSRRRRAEG